MRAALCSIGFFLLFPLLLSGQDYVVTIKGDTLRGKTQLLSYDIVDRVEIKIEKKKNSLTALQVKAAAHDGVIYHPIKFNNRYTFMQLLKEGYLSYYAFRVDKLLTYDGRYLQKRDGTGIELPNLTFRKVMGEFLADCPELKKRFDENEVGKKDLEKIIDEYNGCINKKTVAALAARNDSTAIQYSSELQALETFRKKVESAEGIATRADALDIVRSMEEKIKKNEPVPKFLLDGLKGYLNNTPLQKDTEELIAILQEN